MLSLLRRSSRTIVHKSHIRTLPHITKSSTLLSHPTVHCNKMASLISAIHNTLHISTHKDTNIDNPEAESDKQHTQHDTKQFHRLPTNIAPTHYDVLLKPDLTAFTFNGIVKINVNVKEATDTVVLNSADIEIQSVTVQLDSDAAAAPHTATVTLNAEAETATFKLSQSLTAGTDYILVINYTGTLNDQLKGFYRSKYTDINGVDKYMAVTQFESTDARRALPCWDEPAWKATFTVHISAAKSLTVVSNMPAINSTADTQHSDNVVHTFDKSPIMSTYLLAFVVGEFDYVETKTNNGTIVRVYTAVGKKHQGEFALDTGKRALEFYNQYFNIPYPLPKMDQLAIPDFSAGAMENWGCITYRETALLVDEHNTSLTAKRNIALTVCHEIAHQWFGNLVTMEWWTHLWLNEGYATWMETFCVDALFPQWNIWQSYVASDYASAMENDALANSHAIEIEVGHPDEVDEIFDTITYAKGSAVIRMLENYLGSSAFQQGMSKYLNHYAYKNALTQDLWAVLQNASSKPVSEVMTAWTKQTGYPLLTVTEPTVNKTHELQITIKQQRFLSNGDNGGDDTWPVPISFVLPNNQSPSSTQLLHEKEATITIASGISTVPAWIKLNAGQTALYRTLYPVSMYNAFKQAIISQDSSLGPTERLGIQNDAFALCRAGLLSTVQVLDLVSAYINETDYNVWSDLSSNLNELGHLLAHHSNPDTYVLYSKYISMLYTPICNQIGWTKQTEETSQTTLLRTTVLGMLGRYGHEQTVHHGISLFQQYYIAAKNKQPDAATLLPADLRSAVYSMSVTYGGILAYNNALELYNLAELNEEKTRILRALGSTHSRHLQHRTLQYALSTNVRSQDAPWVILSVAAHRTGIDTAWSFVQQQWSELVKRYGGGFALSRLVTVGENYAHESKATEIERFFKTHDAPAAERSIKQTCERVRSNAKWLQRDGDAIRQWLVDHMTGTQIITLVE